MSVRRSHGTTSKITLRRPYFTLPRCVSMDLVQHAWELRVRTSAMHKIQQLGSSCHVFDPLTWRACRLRRGGSPIQPDLSHCSFKLPQKSAVQPTLRIAMDLAWRKKEISRRCLGAIQRLSLWKFRGCDSDRSLFREARAGFFSCGGSAPPTSVKLLSIKSSQYTWQLSLPANASEKGTHRKRRLSSFHGQPRPRPSGTGHVLKL